MNQPASVIDVKAPELSAKVLSPSAVEQSRPTLLQDRSFWGMMWTQLLGAFTDNLYKQLMLLLAVPVVVAGAAAGGAGQGVTFKVGLPSFSRSLLFSSAVLPAFFQIATAKHASSCCAKPPR